MASDQAPASFLTLRQRWSQSRMALLTWWGHLSPARQDRMAMMVPLFSVLLFLAAIATSFWYLHNEEEEREQESIKRDIELVHQQMRLQLIDAQEHWVQMSHEVIAHHLTPAQFLTQAQQQMRSHPEILGMAWLDAERHGRAYALSTNPTNATPPPEGLSSAAEPSYLSAEPPASHPASQAFQRAADTHLLSYSEPFAIEPGQTVFQVHLPLVEHGTLTGMLVADIDVEPLLMHAVPTEIAGRHVLSLRNSQGEVIASTAGIPSHAIRPPTRLLSYAIPFAPVGPSLQLRGEGYRTSPNLIGNTLFWMVVALSVLTVWTLFGTWRHMKRRLQIQRTLVQETNFRRAMENSMPTGMRAMDMQGRITYVNPAFCSMTGFSEADLISYLPPFPYWPLERIEENSRLFQQELSGRTPAGGVEVKIQRKDGSQFDARMYVSPLIDPQGEQTGWMTSVTNITEAKRVRDQLTAAHERFTTVLEGLDAAVSVCTVSHGELLFVNRSYRMWFNTDPRWHALLAGQQDNLPTTNPAKQAENIDDLGGLSITELTDAGVDSHEVCLHAMNKWFDVRARYLQWTDGRLVQMLIATDITERRRFEEQAALQAERAQVSSRLITMGEMASSVAHELNQPLTAITNYCSGMVSRVKAGSIDQDTLIGALEKTSRQAQRAGQIIHRIRAFVKKSEPQRQEAKASQIVENALELAGIELRRRSVTIHSYVAQRLPSLHVDPILIEQVLLNLLKNAAEAIDTAQMPKNRRHIELRVTPRHKPDQGGMIEFSVSDTGPGMKDDVAGRLYEAFFSTKADGLGIGLSLCRSIIESHQGRITAENIYNGEAISGCRFSFTLPVGNLADSSKHAAQ
ncbi:MAG: PAS domain S-box protein [Leptothrix ochracea]|uniref:PAS domain S-box protein n=1 Tax=Leptothrix ochracea TaxID=735331 RepID=UPI0034E1CB71